MKHDINSKNLDELRNRIIRTSIIGSNQCWEHSGHIYKNGYAYISFLNKLMPKHRASYLAFYGEVTNGKDICHKCDNRKCSNPAHLFEGSRKENMYDCFGKGRGSHQKKETSMICKNGHDMNNVGFYIRTGKTGWQRKRCKECCKMNKG